MTTKSSLELLKEYRAIVDEGRVNIKSEEYDTEEQAEEAAQAYFMNYHPAGYGTRLNIDQNKNGKWIYYGYRYDSAD